MGKLKCFLIIAAAFSVPILCCTSNDAAGFIQKAAYISAGAYFPEFSPSETSEQTDETSSDEHKNSSSIDYTSSSLIESDFLSSSTSVQDSADNNTGSLESSYSMSTVNVSSSLEVISTAATEPVIGASGADSSSEQTSTIDLSSEQTSTAETELLSEQTSTDAAIQIPERKIGKIITKNYADFEDDTDYSIFTNYTADIWRYAFEKSDADDYITLESGAQVRNCTNVENAELIEASKVLPSAGGMQNSDTEPQVLIYHTHTTESYLPYGDKFDEEYPVRSRDPERNMTAVGDAICEALSEQGIASVHDCKVHDYPQYTGAYYRSADTIMEDMGEYPSIKIVLDIHRDGIIEEDGDATAPSIQINGKSAAQFMIITGCDNGEFDMPNYMENFKLACLLQNTAEKLYPNLARSVLFDYRNYNQSLSSNILLIEIGSQGNSLEEAVYTGELLGNIIAAAINTID